MRRLHASPVLNTVYPSRVHPHRENVRKLRSLRSAVSLSRVPSFLLLFPFFFNARRGSNEKVEKATFHVRRRLGFDARFAVSSSSHD